jgi:flagellar biosynthesis chaperone FliJ
MNSTVDEMIVNEIAAKELRIAADNCRLAENELKEAEFKYHKLVQFRQDYVDRFDNEMKRYVAEESHQGFRSFFSRLDVVIFEQQDIITSLERKVKIQRQLVDECKKKALFLEEEALLH